jgi:hypothetical protein
VLCGVAKSIYNLILLPFLGWAHVLCALYIPEVRFGNVSTMEPIILSSVPNEKFQKVSLMIIYCTVNTIYAIMHLIHIQSDSIITVSTLTH